MVFTFEVTAPFSSPMYTVRPKKNGSPQSKMPCEEAQILLYAELFVRNRVSALAIENGTGVLLPPLKFAIVALRLSIEAGQKNPW